MKQSINLNQFREAFIYMGRGEQFSYEGLTVLYDFLEELSSCCEEDYELDVIALCCEFTEEDIADTLSNYSLDTIEELEDNTLVMHVDDETIIYMNY